MHRHCDSYCPTVICVQCLHGTVSVYKLIWQKSRLLFFIAMHVNNYGQTQNIHTDKHSILLLDYSSWILVTAVKIDSIQLQKRYKLLKRKCHQIFNWLVWHFNWCYRIQLCVVWISFVWMHCHHQSYT